MAVISRQYTLVKGGRLQYGNGYADYTQTADRFKTNRGNACNPRSRI